MQQKITSYIESKQKHTMDKEVLRKLKKLAERHSIQYALLWYIYLRSSCNLKEL